MNIKKLTTSFGVVSLISALPFTVVSCGSNDNETWGAASRDFNAEYDFSRVWTEGSLTEDFVKEVYIDNWIDGDTFKYRNLIDDGSGQMVPETGPNALHSLRITLIDTPESHVQNGDGEWVDVTGIEKEWADKAQGFGLSLMPNHSIVKIVTNGSQTYGRDVGSVFFGDSYERSYQYEIIKAGLALPMFPDGLYIKTMHEYDIMHYLAVPLGDAYNYALNNKVGLFSTNLDDTLHIHGSTNLGPVEYDVDDKESIYNYLDVDFWSDGE